MAEYVFPEFETKDSGERTQFEGGGQRDSAAGKPRFNLLLPEGVPYEKQLLTRWAALMERGSRKYEARNWEKFQDPESLDHAKESAFRHFMQWLTGETDEDHAAAILANVLFVENIKAKLEDA